MAVKVFENVPNEITQVYCDSMSIDITTNGDIWRERQQIALIIIYAVVAVIIASLITKKRKLKDR